VKSKTFIIAVLVLPWCVTASSISTIRSMGHPGKSRMSGTP